MNTQHGLPEPSNGESNHASVTEDQQSHASASINNQTHGIPNRSARTSARKKTNTKSNQICRFFLTKAGCRAGDQCRFQHTRPADALSIDPSGTSAEISDSPATSAKGATSSPPDTASKSVFVSRPFSKPVSQKELEDPREYQITQIVRRYSPFRADLDDKATLKFKLTPTDPDFPFELETGLHCILNVPNGYPQDGRPSLQVQNPEMPKGFQINVEKGFDSLVEQYPGKSLLALLNELDKNLERFLTSVKATTVKFVTPARNDQIVQDPKASVVSEPVQQPVSRPVIPRYSLDQLREAKIRRDAEIRQLEARLGRSENFSKAGDGIAFNVPLQVPFSDKTPVPLRSLRETALIVPEVYPLEPCTIILRGVDGDEAENVELAFEERMVANSNLSLMAHINYLTQNLGKMSVDQRPRPEAVNVAHDDENEDVAVPTNTNTISDGVADPNRPHLKYIARPPEWGIHNGHDSSDETGSSNYGSDDDEDDDDQEADSELESMLGGASLPATSGTGIERGISLSFPGLDIQGIELLEVTSLSISIKCERCKEPADIKNIKPSKADATTVHRSETCTKCTAPLTFTFRSELMHMNNNRAGYVDVENCTISDLLPSTFQPTCSSCSTPHPATAAITLVHDDHPTTTNCRTCHAKMTLRIPNVKFLRISTTASSTPLPLRARKPKESLGITANTPLPDNGKCTHYSKSYRWFRFSCCNIVYPCDKCHDTSPSQKDDPHPNEHADRMICGWCSREQRYHPDTCRFCGHSVVRKVVTTGFWEGGKGTRDKNLMRRKEGRKFKRSGKEKKEVEAARNKRKEGKGKGGMWWPG